MTVCCIDCQHFNLRTAGQMARHGYGHCEQDGRKCAFQSATFPRNCRGHAQADATVGQRRREWLGFEHAKFVKEVTQ